jgi:hypothetical protein
MMTFRNAYADINDIMVQFKVRTRTLGEAHDGPDGLGLRVLGLGSSLVVGGGRNLDLGELNQATVYPSDPDLNITRNKLLGTLVGTPLVKPDGGGHAIGLMAQNNVGTLNHKRWVIADFDEATNAAAAILIADTSDDGLYWQLPTYLDNTISSDANSFTITGVNGATLRGVILHPGGTPVVTIGTKARGSTYALRDPGTLADDPALNPRIAENRYLHIQSSGDGAFLVAMTLQPQGQPHPTVERVSGTVSDATVRIGARTYNLLHDDVLYDGSPYAPPAATVTFNPGSGGIITVGEAVQTVSYGGSASEPMVIAADGYTFLGWDRAFSPVVTDMTVNAVYASFGPQEPDGFAAWIDGYPSTPSELRGPADNPSGDGLPNLLKYALGLNPAISDPAGAIDVYPDGDYMVLWYRVSDVATDVSVTPQFSRGLAADDWDDIPSADIIPLDSANGVTVYEAAVPIGSGPVFLRLSIQLLD